MEFILKVSGAVATLIAGILIIILVCGIPTMLLWNWLMPALFHLPEIGFLQAYGLVALSSIFFKK